MIMTTVAEAQMDLKWAEMRLENARKLHAEMLEERNRCRDELLKLLNKRIDDGIDSKDSNSLG
jgi:hypothetical protein